MVWQALTDPAHLSEWAPFDADRNLATMGPVKLSTVGMPTPQVSETFPKGAALKDPSGLFNSSLDGNARRAIDIHEGDKVDEAALNDLIRAAVALHLKGKSKPKPRRASSKRAD
jgi:hypothetical protein